MYFALSLFFSLALLAYIFTSEEISVIFGLFSLSTFMILPLLGGCDYLIYDEESDNNSKEIKNSHYNFMENLDTENVINELRNPSSDVNKT